MKKIIKSVLLLGVICIISAIGLTYVYSFTKPKIEQYKKKSFIDSLNLVLPNAVKFEETIADKKWSGYDEDGNITGIAIKCYTTGYAGPIKILFGMDNDKKVIKAIIIEQNETLGLGSKVKSDNFLNQFEGKSQAQIKLTKDDQDGQIDALTGATISSRAVTDTINESMSD